MKFASSFVFVLRFPDGALTAIRKQAYASVGDRNPLGTKDTTFAQTLLTATLGMRRRHGK